MCQGVVAANPSNLPVGLHLIEEEDFIMEVQATARHTNDHPSTLASVPQQPQQEQEEPASSAPRPIRPILKQASSIASDSSTTTNKTKHKRQVAFDTVAIRSYRVTLGDSPSCTRGVPVTLDWEYEELSVVDIDDCCQGAPRQQPPRHFLLNGQERHQILRNAGFSADQLKRAERAMARAKRQRKVTGFFLPITKWEQVMHRAGRKVQKTVMVQVKHPPHAMAMEPIPPAQ